jgi:lantibiotic leader peptide-processing serine protease
MRRATRSLVGSAALLSTGLVVPTTGATVAASAGAVATYVVLAHDSAAIADAAHAVTTAGGHILRTNDKIALLTVTSARVDFIAKLAGAKGVDGVAHNSPIGHNRAPSTGGLKSVTNANFDSATAPAPALAPAPAPAGVAAEPLAAQQWDMAQIHATPTGSYAVNRGDRRVTVGMLDSGLDWNHPDIAANLDRAKSRNFRSFKRAIDASCVEACTAPLGVDPGGHGTAMASLVAAPLNGFGIGGVAPNVSLVDLRVGQPGGFVLIDPVVNALTYAADAGIDVANMSFSIDPWFYNCVANPADSPAEQAEQRAIILAFTRAAIYARSRNVTLVAAAGNENTNIDAPGTDVFSPDLPNQTAHDRAITPGTCLYLPAMAPGVVTVSGTESTTDKGDISNYGRSIDIAAPSASRTTGTPPIVQAISREGAINNGWLDPATGDITGPISKECVGTRCAYYAFVGGTSDSTAEVSGVAALIISRYGTPVPGRGLELSAASVERRLYETAQPHACPATDPVYVGFPPFLPSSAHCAPTTNGNSFYGHGIVDALAGR